MSAPASLHAADPVRHTALPPIGDDACPTRQPPLADPSPAAPALKHVSSSDALNCRCWSIWARLIVWATRNSRC